MLARCNAQNPSSYASAIHEPRTYRCTTWFRKGRGTRNQSANIHWVIEKAKEFQKISTSASSTTLKPLPVWITKICGNFLKRWQYQPTLHVFWETCMQVKKEQLELDDRADWFKIRKGISQGCILSPCLFNLYAEYIMRNARVDESQAGIKVARRNINNLR